MNKGGMVKLEGLCTVTMVSADHSPCCVNGLVVGGEPADYVIATPAFRIYHARDTNVFDDM